MAGKDDIGATLQELVATERRARELHAALARKPRGELLAALGRAVRAAAKGKSEVAALTLLCAARLYGEFETPEAVDGLIAILGGADADARLEAGEQLQGIAEDHFRLVAERVRRLTGRSGPPSAALLELPYVLAETGHPDVTALLAELLEHRDADVVAAAIEGLTLLGDRAAVERLEPLRDDRRPTELGGDGRERFEATVGELALEAIEMLTGGPEGEEPGEP